MNELQEAARRFLWRLAILCLIILILQAIKGIDFGRWTVHVLFLVIGAILVLQVYWFSQSATRMQKKLSSRGETPFPNPSVLAYQSPEVREVYAHLTPAEKGRLQSLGRQMGQRFGVWLAFPLAVAGMGCFLLWSHGQAETGFMVLGVFVLYFVFLCLPLLRGFQRSNIEFLCQTEWARSHGYTTTRLRWKTFPWSS